MLKELIWKSFEKTGKVDFYLLFKEMESDQYQDYLKSLASEEAAISQS